MNRTELKQLIYDRYGIEPEHPWMKYPDYEVFRHTGNQKWFALIMDIPENKLGLQGDEMIDILDLKCDPALIGSLLNETGFFPAYHMNKNNWITLALNGSVDDNKTELLLDMSYEATAPKIKRRKC